MIDMPAANQKGLPPTAKTHAPASETAAGATTAPGLTLRTFALAAIASLSPADPSPSSLTPEMKFLLAHLDAVDPLRNGWLAVLSRYFGEPDEQDTPLLRVALELDLSLVETLTVALAAAVEDDVMVGRALAHVQAPLGGSRPTLGLLASAFAATGSSSSQIINNLINGTAMRCGLLALSAEGPPVPELAVSVPLLLCLALRGEEGDWPGTQLGLGALSEIPLPDSIKEEAHKQAGSLLVSTQPVLVVRTCSTAEGRTVAALMAAAIKRRALFLESEKLAGIAPWLMLRRLLPVFCFELAPGERKLLPALPFYQGPVLVLCGTEGSIETERGAAPGWSLPVPRVEEREALWEKALGNEELARELAEHHRHGSGRIAHLGELARRQGNLNGRFRPNREDVVAASWIGEGAGLDALAQPLTSLITDEALIMAPALREELQLLLLRCRTRDQLAQGLGASIQARYYTGVRALFVGPSGTGKTLAAGWLATRLGIPLYRVDLASITSKYIGETEKNLSQLLARAEQAEVMLLFDEADSLFGKRTDVKEANDRFANAQTNYLLQRIESFDGITLLTSNSRARFDSAFSRRLDMIVDFPLPGPEERRALWQSHLGQHHHLSQKDLNRLAAATDLCGGNIRNVVLTAAVVARDEQRPIEFADVVRGLSVEFRKLGRELPMELKIER